jgi:hypothetical protein
VVEAHAFVVADGGREHGQHVRVDLRVLDVRAGVLRPLRGRLVQCTDPPPQPVRQHLLQLGQCPAAGLLDARDPVARPQPDGDRPIVVEPYRLVSWQRRWYLVGRVDGRWRALRVDRVTLRMPMHQRFPPDPMPGEDYTAFVLREVAATGWSVHARITVLAPAADVLARINPTVGVVESVDEATSVLVTGADSLEVLAVYIGMLGLEFRVGGPPALVEHLRVVGERYARAVSPPAPG